MGRQPVADVVGVALDGAADGDDHSRREADHRGQNDQRHLSGKHVILHKANDALRSAKGRSFAERKTTILTAQAPAASAAESSVRNSITRRLMTPGISNCGACPQRSSITQRKLASPLTTSSTW